MHSDKIKDELLQCLVIFTKLHNNPYSADALTIGLPVKDGDEIELFSLKSSRSLFSRAASRAGFASTLVRKDLEQISPLVLPCILMLRGKKACILQSFSKDKKTANIITPELSTGTSAIEISKLKEEASGLIRKMSSGHAIVLLIITKLVAITEEKTLILLDEPESHLHPPLLSAFIRALSDLLYDQNGIAIVATHSPVVLQEIPRLCVSKIQRVGLATNVERPSIETFGENVGVLTREVFGLEVVKSGFHKLLTKSVAEGQTYEEIIRSYNEQLGMEAKVLLKLLINERDKNNV